MKDNDGLLKDLPVDTEEKDFGVKFHSSMKFESHISGCLDLPEKPELPEIPPKYGKDQRIMGN